MSVIVCWGVGAIGLACWTRSAVFPERPLTFEVLAPLAAAVVAAFVETIPVRLDDNVSVPAAAAAVLWLASLMSSQALNASAPKMVDALPYAVLVNAIAAWLGRRAGTVSTSGTIVGALIGIIIYVGGGPRAWMFLFVTFVLASVVSRLGLERKVLLGIAEERAGRRGAGNAIANCGVATVAALAAAATTDATAARLAFIAALTAG